MIYMYIYMINVTNRAHVSSYNHYVILLQYHNDDRARTTETLFTGRI